MIYRYKGHFLYNQKVISDWNNSQIGVYYCGFIAQDGTLTPLYIGKAVGKEGIRGRLLQHLIDENWPGVTHFGYCVCDTDQETTDFELAEIAKHKPKYNTQGKSYGY